MVDESIKFLTTLRALGAREVDFILIGGVAAVLRGAPITTMGLDIVHSRKPENVERLGRALSELGSYYREHSDRKPKPQLSLLAGPGPLDVLGEIIGGLTFDNLLQQSSDIELEPGLSVRVPNLRELVRIKESLGREKDRAVLGVLRRTLEIQEGHG